MKSFFSHLNILTLLLLIFFSAHCGKNQGNNLKPPYEVTLQKDLQYGSWDENGTSHGLFLDLYLPKGDFKETLQVLIFIHGGGWLEGSKENCPGNTYAQNGYATACIDYRLTDDICSSTRIFPTQVYDVKTAIRWLRIHASDYNLNANRFGLIGDSSGGHLAALVGTSPGVKELEGSENLDISDKVQAVCDLYGPVDIMRGPRIFDEDPCTTAWETLNQLYGGEETQYFYWTYAWGRFLGGSLIDPVIQERAVLANPITHIDATDPPFLIIHGTTDTMVPIEQSQLLADALEQIGIDVTFITIEGLGHTYRTDSGEVHEEILNQTLEFFRANL